ncbi:MAG TPA: Zn-ribbon domain-containing OB-fold protein [Actinomycetota bacterium]|nr:Zn-ribbon domain-containing OB-fold protein [Actinomycetota bacterium]
MTPKRDLRSVDDTQPTTFYGPTSLTNDEFRNAVGAVDFAVDARYAWDTGVAISRFLDGLREGRILGRECRSCGRTLVPPRMFCEECFRPTDRWVEVPDRGTVNTFSICYIRWDMVELEEPELPFVLELDIETPMMGFMHKLGEVDPQRIEVGMEVEAVWKPEGERRGSILDIRHFRPRDAALRKGARKPASARKKTGAKRSGSRKKTSAKRKAG